MKENLGKKVKELNARIEEIRDQRTRAETRKETLLGQLKGQIKEYEKLYGIKLSGEGYSGVEKAISGEMDRVSKEIQKEYDLKVSVVEAIDSGNIDEAFRLLGMENPNKASEEDIEEEVEGGADADGVELADADGDQPIDAEYEEDAAKMGKKSGKQSGKQGNNSVSLNTQSAEEVFDEFNGDDDDGFGFDGFEFDDSDDGSGSSDDYAGPTGPSVVKKSGKTSKSGKTTGNATTDLSGFGIEFDDDDDDFGFGDILSGSKFE